MRTSVQCADSRRKNYRGLWMGNQRVRFSAACLPDEETFLRRVPLSLSLLSLSSLRFAFLLQSILDMQRLFSRACGLRFSNPTRKIIHLHGLQYYTSSIHPPPPRLRRRENSSMLKMNLSLEESPRNPRDMSVLLPNMRGSSGKQRGRRGGKTNSGSSAS